MTKPKDEVYLGLWADDLEEVDREIVKMSALARVRILDPGVIRRVLQNDASVCATHNPAAFRKLHDLLMLHIGIREKSAEAFGEALTERLEDAIVERLRKSFPDLEGKWPPQ
jgi:hypothetical protein